MTNLREKSQVSDSKDVGLALPVSVYPLRVLQ